MFFTALVLGALPKPTPAQLAWQNMELNAFIHFGPNTFNDVEWGGGKEDPNLFNPTALDCNQWASTFKKAGFKGIIITAKHHDGFCLWPSKFSTHTVAQSQWKNGQGDVLRELSQACRKNGLKFGVYLSPWDRNHPTYGTPEYNQVFTNMLQEVLTQYGPVFEVWFDGANGEGPTGKKQVYDWPLFNQTVKKFQANAVIFSDAGPDIRWVGNEQGIAGETCWSTIPSGRYVPGTPHYLELTEGSSTGDSWVPAECDVSIRPGWFYHADQDDKVRSPENLLDLYEKSVGRNSLLLLNVPPDRRGLIADPDIRSLEKFAQLKRDVYSKPIAKGKTSVQLKGSTRVTRIDLRENIKQGQQVHTFIVGAKIKGIWTPVAQGTTIGRRRIVKLKSPIEDATEFRVQTEPISSMKEISIALY